MRSALLVTLLWLATALLTGCDRQEEPPTSIVFLLASGGQGRWASADEPAFAARVAETCRGCEYSAVDAGGDADVQEGQLRRALAGGADVVVLHAVDSERAEELVVAAGDVPVVAYDRFVPGADYYVSYDAARTGVLQAGAVVAALAGRGRALVLNGPRTDANGVAIGRAVDRVLGRTRIRVLAEMEPRTWSADEARAWTARQLRRHPQQTVDAVVAANDEQAEGALRAFRAAGAGVADLPFVTGQDAELDALRRIVRGEQGMTVAKPIDVEAERAADLAVTLLTGGRVRGTEDYEGVPSFVFEPVPVDLGTLTETVVRSGLYTTAEICDQATAVRCERLGIR